MIDGTERHVGSVPPLAGFAIGSTSIAIVHVTSSGVCHAHESLHRF